MIERLRLKLNACNRSFPPKNLKVQIELISTFVAIWTICGSTKVGV